MNPLLFIHLANFWIWFSSRDSQLQLDNFENAKVLKTFFR